MALTRETSYPVSFNHIATVLRSIKYLKRKKSLLWNVKNVEGSTLKEEPGQHYLSDGFEG